MCWHLCFNFILKPGKDNITHLNYVLVRKAFKLKDVLSFKRVRNAAVVLKAKAMASGAPRWPDSLFMWCGGPE